MKVITTSPADPPDFRRSVELNPQNTNATDLLKKLEKKNRLAFQFLGPAGSPTCSRFCESGSGPDGLGRAKGRDLRAHGSGNSGKPTDHQEFEETFLSLRR
jgi:predicted secreted protein